MGGDEININKLNSSEINNYGWPISSYGEHYGSRELNKENYLEAPLYKSHLSMDLLNQQNILYLQ